MGALPFAACLVFPAAALAGLRLGGAWHLLVPAVAFVLLPLADALVGTRDFRGEPAGQARAYRAVTYAVALAQSAFLLLAAREMGRGGGVWEWTAFVLSAGIVTGGIGITLAHELCHRSSRLETLVGQALLLQVCYMHFGLEHVAGHHRRVATPEDPASARPGESLYAFLPRTIAGSWLSARAHEAARLSRKGLPAWSPENRLWVWTLLPAALVLALGAAFGPLAGVFFLMQSAVAVLLLETMNYIEHYGLRRRRLEDGRYEPVTTRHSWNSAHALSNVMLFRLQLHSDHHAYPGRRYQELRHRPESPQLPQGYPAMLLLALAPALWRRVMDPRAERARREPPVPAAAAA